jgi:hypothetical protein
MDTPLMYLTWLKAVVVFFGKSLACHIEFLIPIRSIKHSLITKLITQIEANLRDESIKSN